MAIAALAPAEFQGIAAGLFAAWAFREWRSFAALRRYENVNCVRILSVGPFVPIADANSSQLTTAQANRLESAASPPGHTLLACTSSWTPAEP